MFEPLDVLGEVVEDTVSSLLFKVMQVSADSFGRVFGIKGMQENGLHGVPVVFVILEYFQGCPTRIGLFL
jgi:hypothetical protein